MIGAVAITYFLYNAGYWLPFGGGSPGPRFLIPALPFLAIGLGSAYRRLPALTLGLAIPSAIFMVAGALTYPLIGDNGTGVWANQLGDGTLEHTLLTVLGVRNGWLAVAPVLAAVATAIVFAALATPRTRLGNVRPALAAVLGWAVVSIAGPTVAGDPVTPLDDGPAALSLIAVGVVASLTALLALRYRERRAEPAPDGSPCRRRPPSGPMRGTEPAPGRGGRRGTAGVGGARRRPGGLARARKREPGDRAPCRAPPGGSMDPVRCAGPRSSRRAGTGAPRSAGRGTAPCAGSGAG